MLFKNTFKNQGARVVCENPTLRGKIYQINPQWEDYQ